LRRRTGELGVIRLRTSSAIFCVSFILRRCTCEKFLGVNIFLRVDNIGIRHYLKIININLPDAAYIVS